MKYWLTISSALLKMLIRLRLIIADLALFYVEKSLKSERTLYPKLEVHLFSSFIHCPKNTGFPTVPVCLVPQPEVSPDLPLPPRRKNTKLREKSSCALAFTTLYLRWEAKVVAAREQQKAWDTAAARSGAGSVGVRLFCRQQLQRRGPPWRQVSL